MHNMLKAIKTFWILMLSIVSIANGQTNPSGEASTGDQVALGLIWSGEQQDEAELKAFAERVSEPDFVADLARRTLEIGADDVKTAIDVDHSLYSLKNTGDEVGPFLNLSVNVNGVEGAIPRAHEFMDQWVAKVKTEFSREFPVTHTPEITKLRVELERAEARVIAQPGRERASHQAFIDNVNYPSHERRAVEEQIRNNKLDIELTRARLELLISEISERSKSLEKAVQQDPVISELQRVVKLREEKLQRLRQADQDKTFSEIEVDAVTELAESRAQLAEVMRSVLSEVGGSNVAKLNADLLDARLRLKELRIRQDHLAKRLSQFDERDRLLANMEAAKAESVRATNAMSSAFAEYRAALNATMPKEELPTELFVLSRHVTWQFVQPHPAATP